MATVPLSGTDIYLLSNVPFSNDYKNTRWFDTQLEQTNYFLNKPRVHTMSQATFQRIEGQRYIRADKSIDSLWGCNYVMFRNTNYNNKWFYGFVTELEYKNTNLTLVHFQIDVFQTWCFDMDFKPSFVVREHRDLWNADGSPVINTIDEGLNYGSEYETVSIENYQPYESDIFFLVIVSKETMHSGGAGQTTTQEITPVLNGMPQPLSYYVQPFRMDGTSPNVMMGSAAYEISPILETLQAIFKQENAVNNVVSMYVTDYIGHNPSYDDATDTMTFSDSLFGQAYISDNVNLNIQTIYLKEMGDYLSSSKIMGGKYDGYNNVSESKLLMYPYTVLILDDFKGNRVVLKNEYIDSNDIKITVRGSMGTSNKVSYGISDYLTRGLDAPDQLKASLEHSAINNNPSDIPILSDYLSAYLQGNKNSLENQKNTIMFNGIMGAIGGGMDGVSSGVLGGMSKTKGGRVAGAFGVAEAGVDVVQGVGNTVLQLQALEAKKKDINNIPANLVKMGSNTAFDYGNRYSGVYVIKKQITAEYRNTLTNFFNMFGYKTNETKIPNFHTRQYWNYVQTTSCIITGNFNNEDLQELKSIFDNGITFWHTDDLGNYALENGVI